tara:strand:+ start:528 stop:713 length:186 start_codon:yes stop_codon:yes gene_type:complete
MKIEKWNRKTKKFEFMEVDEEEFNFLLIAMSVAQAELDIETRKNRIQHKLNTKEEIKYKND